MLDHRDAKFNNLNRKPATVKCTECEKEHKCDLTRELVTYPKKFAIYFGCQPGQFASYPMNTIVLDKQKTYVPWAVIHNVKHGGVAHYFCSLKLRDDTWRRIDDFSISEKSWCMRYEKNNEGNFICNKKQLFNDVALILYCVKENEVQDIPDEEVNEGSSEGNREEQTKEEDMEVDSMLDQVVVDKNGEEGKTEVEDETEEKVETTKLEDNTEENAKKTKEEDHKDLDQEDFFEPRKRPIEDAFLTPKRVRMDSVEESMTRRFAELERSFNEKLEEIKSLLVHDKSIAGNEPTVYERREDNSMESKVARLMKTADTEELDKILAQIDFEKAEDDKYYCKVCYNNCPLSPSSPGLFSLSASDDNNDLEGSGSSAEIRTPNASPSASKKVQIITGSPTVAKKLQTRGFINMKKSMKRHLLESVYHKRKYIERQNAIREEKEHKSRTEKVGLNIFRIRYTAIRQHKSRLAFEDDLVTAQINGTDIGNVNHSRKFAKDLDVAIYSVVKEDIIKGITTPLQATNQKRPLGLAFDKMTPNRRTGQIHALLVPCPENNLDQSFIVPLCLDLPAVKQHDAKSLALTAKQVYNDFGCEDNQLEGIAVDGEYIKKNVKSHLLEILNHDSLLTSQEKNNWITAIWEPAHELELAVKDVRKDHVFQWFERDIQLINEATELLSIGKGLEESIQAATDIDAKLYKLRPLSDTRFVAYFGDTLSNNEKSLEPSLEVLKKKSESASSHETREKASRILNSWTNKQWLLTNSGLVDIFNTMGFASKKLQKCEQFPWDVSTIQHSLIEQLDNMAKLNLSEEIGREWPTLKRNLKDITDGTYKNLKTDIFQTVRQGRSGDDISKDTLSLPQTVQNRLTSLCRNLSQRYKKRRDDRGQDQSVKLVNLFSKCFDIGSFLAENFDFNAGSASLSQVLKIAKYPDQDSRNILEEYSIMISRMRMLNMEKCDDDIIMEMRNIHKEYLYMIHECDETCKKDKKNRCPLDGKPATPPKPIPTKFLHLFFREKYLNNGIPNILHLFLRATMKIHCEGVAESMGKGSTIEIHTRSIWALPN